MTDPDQAKRDLEEMERQLRELAGLPHDSVSQEKLDSLQDLAGKLHADLHPPRTPWERVKIGRAHV